VSTKVFAEKTDIKYEIGKGTFYWNGEGKTSFLTGGNIFGQKWISTTKV